MGPCGAGDYPLVQRYAEFLPIDITVWSQGNREVSRRYPWADDFGSHRSSVQQGVPPVYGGVGVGRQFDVVAINDAGLGLECPSPTSVRR